VLSRPHTHAKGGLRFPQYLSSSSVPHFLQVALLRRPIIYKCLLKVLCAVSRPITTLDCVLLKDNNLALVARSGPEINFRTRLYVPQGTRHNTRCWFSIQRFIFLLIFCLETPKKGSGQTAEQKRPLRACRPFRFLSLRHAQGPSIAPQRVASGYRSTPSGTVVTRERCSGSLKRFQSRLTIRTNANTYLLSVLSFSFMNTD
jgi:hypothetical protein